MIGRGLFRIWIVGTVLWDGFWILVYANERSGDLLYYLPLLISPPLVVLGIGWMFLWALRGFSADR